MSGRDFDVVDRETGDVLVMVRHLWSEDPVDCCMCGKPTFHRFCVPYYERPVAEVASRGGYRVTCEPCYRRWEAWNSQINAQIEYESWTTAGERDHG